MSSDPAFEREALAAFAFIAPSALPSVIERSYDPKSFGNALIVMDGERMRIRVTRDRSQFLTDLAPRGSYEFFDISVALELVGAASDARALEAAEWRELEPSASAIARHYAALGDCLSPERWLRSRASLEALQDARVEKLFGVRVRRR
jgi:hypothetical protein